MSKLFRILAPAAALVVACTPSEGGEDGGLLDGGRNRPPCAVDRYNTRDTALPLALGTPYLSEAAICPPTDRDFYSFSLPGASLVQVDVGFPGGATSAVELAYEIIRLDGAGEEFIAASAQDTMASDNRSALSRRHYLDQGGSYWLRVRDVGDDEQDVLNKYGVTLAAAADPDPNEPNDTCALARPVTGTSRGAITYAGDRDAHGITLPAGIQILDATITTTKASSVDLKASLYDATGRFLTSSTDLRGEDGATSLRVRFGLQSTGGAYCLIVEDDDGADSSPEVPYALSYMVVPEPDVNEQTARNDFPDDAVNLGAGGTRQGYIASTADLDWYVVDVPARRIAEISVSCPGCMIQPSVSLVYGDTDSPCDSNSTCDFLLRPDGDCTVDADCRQSGICRAVPGGQKRCAKACGDRFDCGSFQCQQNGPVSACAGAASCTNGLCGVLQYTGVADAMTGELRTAQPLTRTRTWILVRDFQDDQFVATPYTLTVNIANDPDGREPNNFYFPYTDAEAGDILSRGRDLATRVAWSAAGAGPRTVSGSGCIGYAGDIDIFRLEGGNPCAMGNCGLSIQYNRPGGDVDLAYFLHSPGLGIRSSFLMSNEGMESVFGDAMCGGGQGEECMTYRQDDNGDYYLVVRDFGQDSWDVSAARCYTWTITAAAAAGCPASCPTVMSGNCVCQ